MAIKEIRFIDPDKVRRSCIRNKWYSNGTNEDYDVMLTTCKLITEIHPKDFLSNLYALASDIYHHSEIDLKEYGCTDDEIIRNIMFTLTNDCTTFCYTSDN